jgi:hypothetical protein
VNRADITPTRQLSQQLSDTSFSTPGEIVHYMGAIQAQDYPMAKWAIGLRLPGSIDVDIEAAIARGDLLRTHLLRPTWHFTSPQDIGWLIDLTAPQIKASQRGRDRQLELTEQVYARSNQILEKALGDGHHLTRNQLIPLLNQAGIPTNQNRASHLFMRAELEKVMCSGATRHGKTTYALYSERVPHPRKLSYDEALAELARRYFTSRCPASLQDFTWWSGLRAGDASRAVELVGQELQPVSMEGRTYWLPHGVTLHASGQPSALLLPTYDEFILSYTDRSATIPPVLEQHMKQISNRGVFWPTVLVEGQVVGTWKRQLVKNKLVIELQLFKPLEAAALELIDRAASEYAHFSGKPIELKPITMH